MRHVLWMTAMAFTVACGGGDETDPSDTSTDTSTDTSDTTDTTAADADAFGLTGDAASGENVFGDNCVFCHAADGSGTTAPSFADLLPPLSKQEAADAIVNGTDEGMPSFDGQLSEQEIADVVRYIYDNFAP